MSRLIDFYAGKKALSIIRDEGLKQERVRVIAAAAGGPKWIILSGIDRFFLPEFFKDRSSPLSLVGSSIGAWRNAVSIQKDSPAAFERFLQAYLEQRYPPRPSAAEVTRQSLTILNTAIPDENAGSIMDHPWMRLHIFSARSRHFMKSSSRAVLAAGMGMTWIANSINRRFLNFFFERCLFHDSRDPLPCFTDNDLPVKKITLTAENLKKAVMASGSIPLAMEGISNIAEAAPGTYRDGGLTDYQHSIPFVEPGSDSLVLYPHYNNTMIPGWFDKQLHWRRPDKKITDNILMFCPSEECTASLPAGKIPDRGDFSLFRGNDTGRISYWKATAEKSNEMAEEIHEAVASGRIANMVKPLR